MKRIFSALIAGTIAAGGFVASASPITRFKSAPVLTLNAPTSPDSTMKENPFAPEMLLKARPNMPLRALRNMTADWTTMTTDTAGKVTLPKAVEKPLLHTLSSRLRASRFAKGRLVLTTNARGEITVNGNSVAKKISADSVPTDASGDLTLNPETDYEIRVNILSMPEDSIAPEFKVEFIPEDKFKEVAIEQGADISRRFSTRGTMTGERVSLTQLSPDGKYMLVSYSDRFSAETTINRLELMETQSGKILSTDLPTGASWMPKGATLYYTSRAGVGHTLWKMDVPSMKAEVLARNIPESGFNITPDNRYLIYYKKVDGSTDAGPMKRVKSPDDRIPGDRDRYYLMRYDLKDASEIALTYGGATTYIDDISRDGSKILYTSMVMDPTQYPLYFKDLIQMDINTLKTDTILRHDPFFNDAVYSPDMKQLFITGSPQAFNGIGANAGEHEIPNDFDIQGFIYTIADGSVIPVTKDFDPSIQNGVVWSGADNNIYFRGEKGFGINVY
ncbi:MAG: S9 family peptidase, partial [Muribaculaceae bacterium]|nr:S9 family peptidase [Muribaculaceae bacterium]